MLESCESDRMKMDETLNYCKKFALRDNRLVFLESPVTLERMASTRVVLNIWHRSDMSYTNQIYIWNPGYIPEFGKRLKEDSDFTSDMAKELTTHWQVPPSILNKIAADATEMRDQLTDWIRYHCQEIFDDNCRVDNIIIRHAQKAIWNGDGEINYLKTAKRLLASSGLSKIEKCKLMFTYCFKDDIKALSSTLYDEKYFSRIPLLPYEYRHPMLWYWKNYLSGVVPEINETDTVTPEYNVITSTHVNNVYAFEYFWSRLRNVELMDVVRRAIHVSDTPTLIFVLTRLSSAQLELILTGEDIFFVLKQLGGYEDFKLMQSLWMQIRDHIPEMGFKIIVGNIIHQYTHYLHPKLLSFIWQNAPDRLKRSVLNSDLEFLTELIKNALVFDAYAIDSITEFLISILNEIGADIRDEVTWCHRFMNFCSQILSHDKVSAVDRIIESCLLESHDVIKLKREIMDTDITKSKCASLCRAGDLDRLNEFLHFFEQDENEIRDYMAAFLHSEKALGNSKTYLVSLQGYRLVNQLIDYYVAGAESCVALKNKLISSDVALLNFNDWLLQKRLQDVKDCFELYLVSVGDSRAVKKKFVKLFKSNSLLGDLFHNLNDAEINEFLLWISNNTHDQGLFKRSLGQPERVVSKMLDIIFENRMSRAPNCSIRSAIDLTPVDRFFDWYFDTKKAIRDCKMLTIFDWERIQNMRLLRQHDESNFEIFISWFLKG